MRDGRRMVACVVVGLSLACAPATIYRPDGPPLEAVIEDSDATTLRVRDQSGTSLALDQTQVSRIDHPGAISVFVGAMMLVLGALILQKTIADAEVPEQRMLGYLTGGPMVFSGGLSVAFGVPSWIRSRRAAAPFNEARPRKPPRAYRGD